MQVKVKILLFTFLGLFLLLFVRLIYWQVIKGSELSAKAKLQYNSSKITQASRGNILASDGSYWVIRTEVWKVIANTNEITDDPKKIAHQLSLFFVTDTTDNNLLMDEEYRIIGLLSKKSAYVPLKDKLNDQTKRNIEALEIKGISFESEEDRYYPEASSAAQLLGFVGKDESGGNLGYFGIEGYYNLPLSGKPGFIGRQKDAQGSPILLGGTKEVNAISGVDLVTSIDKRIQLVIEDELKKGIEKYGATGGHVTVMDPDNGEILAMASFPSYDPREYRNYSDSLFKNSIISDTFEPGSIFKVLVMAAGLDAGVVKPDTECDICSEPLQLDKYFIKTWNNTYHPDITMTDVIVESDNVGMSFVGQKLGADKLFDYLDAFGIGKKTGIDLQGEVAPSMRKKGTWNVVDLATTSFGQGIAVTGIEMIRAAAAIANGGILIDPHVVKSIEGDGWSEKVKIDQGKRVISEKAAKEITQMMVEAANKGEAKWAKIPGFVIAGKTGTAQIPVAGHYDATNTNHSFIGFAPVKNAKFIMLVTLRSPQTSPWAAETAAPLWYSIAKDVFPYLGVQPE